jgi:Fe-S cluster assembly protein SufB
MPNAVNARTHVKCDAIIMDEESESDTKPTMKVHEQRSTVEHEASVSKISEEQLFYAMSRGLSEADARALIVNGFFDFFVKELPMEYAVELNRLIKMEMEGSVG